MSNGPSAWKRFWDGWAPELDENAFSKLLGSGTCSNTERTEDLTLDSVLETIRGLKRAQPEPKVAGDFDLAFVTRHAYIVSPFIEPVPNIQINPAFEWVTPEVRAEINGYLLGRFGTHEEAYVFHDPASPGSPPMMAISPAMAAQLKKFRGKDR